MDQAGPAISSDVFAIIVVGWADRRAAYRIVVQPDDADHGGAQIGAAQGGGGSASTTVGAFALGFKRTVRTHDLGAERP